MNPIPDNDLLSDNSVENDLFFENLGSNVSSKSKPVVSSKSKSNMEDLFGIKEENENAFATQAQKNATTRLMGATSTPRISRQKPSQSNDEDDDDDLGFDPRKPKSGNKLNLLDDLLAPVEQKRPSTSGAASGRRDEAISRQSTDTTQTTENSNILMTQARPKTSQGRRSSGNSTVAPVDPLAFFNAPSGKERGEGSFFGSTTSVTTSKNKKLGTTADWLGLVAEPAEVYTKTEESQAPKNVSPQKSRTEEDIPDAEPREQPVEDMAPPLTTSKMPTQPTMLHQEHEQNISPGKPVEPVEDAVTDILKLNSLNLESNHVFVALQQQETHLALTTQMKNHERALLDMQRKQNALLQQQERQFQSLFQQQLQRQQQMEEHIKVQHQRINAHIQLLMSQPAVSTIDSDPIAVDREESTLQRDRSADANRGGPLDLVQMEADVKRLELEKLRLEELVESMKVNSDREINLIETSYKKQLHVTEEHLAVIESRYKLETTELHEHYQTKLAACAADKQTQKADFEAQVAALKQDHEDELRKLKKSYEDNLEMLKEEHRLMLESIRQAKMLEFAMVQDTSGSGNFLNVLKMASSNLEHLSGGLEGLREDMQAKIETLHRERVLKLELREKRVEDAERHLKITEESAEEEKRRLMDLVSSLEVQLNKLTKEAAEENWLMRQKMSSLDAERAAFEREKKYMREQLERDEKRVSDLKEAQLLEGQKMLSEVQEERARLSVLRSKMEMEQKLQVHGDRDAQQLEVEAALKVAQDAVRQADVERERFYKMQRQLEQEKRELTNQRSNMRSREEELEHQLNASVLAERRCKAAQQLAEQAQQDFHTKARLLQQRVIQLGEKEAQLSQDRLLLAQERIALHNQRSTMSERLCALCKLSAQNKEIANLLSRDAVDQSAAIDMSQANTAENLVDFNNPLGNMQFQQMLGQSNIVERLLDENIADSLAKMKSSSMTQFGDMWNDLVLDDDAKKMALNQLEKS